MRPYGRKDKPRSGYDCIHCGGKERTTKRYERQKGKKEIKCELQFQGTIRRRKDKDG